MIEAYDVGRSYDGGLVRALDGVTFSLAAGETVSIQGPSGSGKSTLLNILGTLDRQTSGSVLFDGRPAEKLGPLPAWRSANVGFIFQFHYLVPTMTLLENVEAAMMGAKIPARERRVRAGEELEILGLSHRANFFPGNVSGGERQRAAIARALAGDKRLILADEPTGQLDRASGDAAASHIFSRCAEKGMALIVVTHNPALATMATRAVEIADGKIVGGTRC